MINHSKKTNKWKQCRDCNSRYFTKSGVFACNNKNIIIVNDRGYKSCFENNYEGDCTYYKLRDKSILRDKYGSPIELTPDEENVIEQWERDKHNQEEEDTLRRQTEELND